MKNVGKYQSLHQKAPKMVLHLDTWCYTWVRGVTPGYVVPHLDTWCYTWIRGVTPGHVVLHLDTWCYTVKSESLHKNIFITSLNYIKLGWVNAWKMVAAFTNASMHLPNAFNASNAWPIF